MNCSSTINALICAFVLVLMANEASAEGKGFNQANTMGDGVAPLPGTGIFRVFILAGQSNMTGHGWARELKPPYNQRHERIRIWANNRWEYFVPKRNFGPGVAMAHQLSALWPEDTIGIIKIAVGGSGILCFQPDWSRESANRTMDGHKGNLYRDMVNAVSAARQVSDFELTGLVWKQGGKDMKSEDLGDEYLSNFTKMLMGLRSDLQAPGLPAFIATYMTSEEFQTFDAPMKLTRPGMASVIKAHLDAAKEIPNVVTFSHGKLPCRVDGIHFNTESQLRFGMMCANSIADYYAPATPEDEERDLIIATPVE